MGLFASYGCVLCVLLCANVLASGTAVNVSGRASTSGDDGELPRPPPAALQSSAWGRVVIPGLPAAVPDDVTDYCLELLRFFGQRYVILVDCLVSSARPVRVCQNCYADFADFQNIYRNISSDEKGPGNASCQVALLRSDRLMLLYSLYSSLTDIWTSAECTRCVTKDQMSLTNQTLLFLSKLNQSLSCFDKYQEGNHSELCEECKAPYKVLNELYSKMATNNTLCIDVEDAMNMTRHLWSKSFNCSFPRRETVPVLAVSSFMLFLPIIFYLSNYLHSEQKKRKLIHPKRAKSSHSLMNIQDKIS